MGLPGAIHGASNALATTSATSATPSWNRGSRTNRSRTGCASWCELHLRCAAGVEHARQAFGEAARAGIGEVNRVTGVVQ